MEKECEDPIAFFTAKAKRLDEERLAGDASLTFTIAKDDPIATESVNRKNFGYAALSKIYHELDLHTFLINRQRHSKEQYDANSIMKMLVFSRLLHPASKKKSFEQRHRFFEKDDYSLEMSIAALLF